MFILNFTFLCVLLGETRTGNFSTIPSAQIIDELQLIVLTEEEFVISHFFSKGSQYLKKVIN